MSIKQLLVIVNLVIVVILGIILGVFLMHNSKTQASVQAMVQVDQALLINLEDMYAQGLQTEQATRNILLNPEDSKAKDNYDKAHADFLKANDDAEKLGTGKTRETLTNIRAMWVEDDALKTQIRKLATDGKRDEAIKLLMQKETPKWREIKDVLLGVIKEQTSIFNRRLEENRSQNSKSTFILIAIILLSIIGVTGFLFVIRRVALKTMTTALECFSTIERGDLKEQNLITSDSNFLKESFNKILTTLRATIGKVSEVSGKVTESVDSLAEKMNTLDNTAKDQLAQVDHIAAAATEMSQTAIDSAKNASYASEMATDATNIAHKGKSTVKETVDAIVAIADSVKESANTIEELGRSSKEIGKIVEVITDIADQTNLLALNAAIEAARAGEQGRGFAVVADEVRKLAERTSTATSEVTQKIRDIQEQAALSVKAMDKSSGHAGAGVTLADEAAKGLDEIVTATQKAMDMIQRIAAAVEEQSAASEDISHNLETIAGHLNETVTMIDESRQIMDGLHADAKELDRNVSWFKI
ncbi:MAG TPA: methyl-accepting chemotaxis protein [Dissulfurispiraceae bacterium]|nr:methyl-accepting chemotaxis protein [Dissulfurispiraceae bacterium]